MVTPMAQVESLEDIAEEDAEEDAPRVVDSPNTAKQSPASGKKRKKRKSVLLKSHKKRPSLKSTAAHDDAILTAHTDEGDQQENEVEQWHQEDNEPEDEVQDDEITEDQGEGLEEADASQDEDSDNEYLGNDTLSDSELDSEVQDDILEDPMGEDEDEEEIAWPGQKGFNESKKKSEPDRSAAPVPNDAVPSHRRKKRRRSIIKGRTKRRSSGDRNAISQQANEATSEELPAESIPTKRRKKGGILKRAGLLKRKRSLTESEGNASLARKTGKQSTELSLSGDKIAVTVHRISHVHRLNFNPDLDDDLAGPGAFPKKKNPNAIDVLAQICREIIGKTIATVKSSIEGEANTSRKAELKRKKDAIETYGDELDGRLFQMTTALDHNYALGVKLKHANKQKAALRDELLDLRKQRQEVELQIDEVRARHEKDARVANEEHHLETLLQDIELAVERGRAAPEVDEEEEDEDGEEEGKPSLSMRLQQAADVMSSADGRVGLLERVKGFNGLLEEAIARL